MTRLFLLCLGISAAACGSSPTQSGTITFCPPNCPAGSDDMSAVVPGGGHRDMTSQSTDGGPTVDLSQASPPPDLLTPIDLMSACAHSLCTVGPKLASDCDPCVTQICATDPYCCNMGWSSICVAEVTSLCHKSCP